MIWCVSMADYDWENYLNFADMLVEDGFLDELDDETKNRIAVSRAYYAAYHYAKCYLEQKKLIGYRSSEHATVINCFADLAKKFKNLSKIYNNINQSLSRLKKDRVSADYYSDKHISSKKARINCLEAHQLINTIKKL